ncbi:hypothetical protein PL84_03860 [Vibrio anguillarum]|uniref:hypothetical protein n=1 Tax=Vibrio anguillarum TaxID=55601 RepID=UPI00097E268A|nr:hypothetical protein [Vibrio anguillarum]MBT2909717.1 hypothetical protein [Vibrio anguillarum]MBT2942432.1 hypothetical protein [Vibrio anguillarum]MBT2950744.1 hypothetical protein [Vibrio anguillarum]MBT2979441.1 hypothetical protein [Vibrio anguillarum]
MTPNALLARVKGQFITLYHDESEKLEALLIQALNEYQDRAGVIRSLTITFDQFKSGGIPVPPYFMTVVTAHDADHMWHEVMVENGNLNVVTTDYSVAPFKVQYLEALSEYDLDNDELPQHATGMLQKYLKVLIEIPNTEREQYSRSAAGLPMDGMPQLSELHEKKRLLEEQMEESGSILMPSMLLQM